MAQQLELQFPVTANNTDAAATLTAINLVNGWAAEVSTHVRLATDLLWQQILPLLPGLKGSSSYLLQQTLAAAGLDGSAVQRAAKSVTALLMDEIDKVNGTAVARPAPTIVLPAKRGRPRGSRDSAPRRRRAQKKGPQEVILQPQVQPAIARAASA